MARSEVLLSFTTEQLEAELERRRNQKPERLSQPDWSWVVNYVVEAVGCVDRKIVLSKDFEHQLMEMVVETMYGKDIWGWWNRKLNGK